MKLFNTILSKLFLASFIFLLLVLTIISTSSTLPAKQRILVTVRYYPYDDHSTIVSTLKKYNDYKYVDHITTCRNHDLWSGCVTTFIFER